jgi:hypothetical protein
VTRGSGAVIRTCSGLVRFALLMGVLACAGAVVAQDVDRGSDEAAGAGLERALDYLVASQNPDGSWGSRSIESLFDDGFAVETYYCYQHGAHSLATLALLRGPETDARKQALLRALRWLVTSEKPLRGSNWDNDAVWAWLYGVVTTTAAVVDPRLQDDEWQIPLRRRGREFVRSLEQNMTPAGGFGYYDDPLYTRRPKWATSFSTAAVLPSLADAKALGWTDDDKTVERATDYVRRCRLPNGAYEYDLRPIPRVTGGESINDTKGSLGRIQVCHQALFRVGDPDTTLDRLRWGIEEFFRHHRFLAVARMRPIPHEAYYANAGYFFYFGHYYAARVIELLPSEERPALWQQLRQKLLETQARDGSFCDYQRTIYMTTSSTAYAALALAASLR